MQHLLEFINAPYDPICNFNLAIEYEELNQTAAAASFYLRAAEKTNDTVLQYVSLIRNALCFDRQGNRDLTVKTLLQRAVSILPSRPEGYFLLGQLYERRKEYHDGYIIVCIGLENITDDIIIKEYPGKYGLLFLKAICGWWVGLTEQSREIIFDLFVNYNQLDEPFKSAVQNNISNIGLPKHKFVYTNSLINELKYPFDNVERIKNNYSQVYQDLFVLTMLNGKENGVYLELGSNDPFFNNNTALLETMFGWNGISIEIDEALVNTFNSQRKNTCICSDALNINYNTLLADNNYPDIIDYLSLDCDPPEISFQLLQLVIDTGYKFRIITFEHDYYASKSIKQLSRSYLKSKGYELLVNDVAFNKSNAFEDWWVLREYVNSDAFKFINSDINFVQDIFYKKLNYVNT